MNDFLKLFFLTQSIQKGGEIPCIILYSSKEIFAHCMSSYNGHVLWNLHLSKYHSRITLHFENFKILIHKIDIMCLKVLILQTVTL